jgi:hypothetical protein
MHNFVERWFESGLRLQPACDLDELNAQAYDSMVKLNALHNHTRTGMPRTQLWLTVTKEHLRELPDEDILNDLFARPEEERTVMGDLTISYRGNTYLLKHIEGIFRGAHVLVVLKPFKWPAVDIAFQGTLYEASPLEALPGIQGGFPVNAAIIGQEYKSQPETVTQQAIKRFENMAYGEEGPGKDRIPFEGLRVFGHHADKVDLTYIQKKGTPMEIDHAITEKHISFTEFLKRLTQRVGAISKELNQSLRAEFGDSIEIHKAEEVINSIEQGAAKSAESREQRA